MSFASELDMQTRKTILEMLGEFCREAAVLIGVFGPLDYMLTDSLTLGRVLAILALSAGLLVTGMVLERVQS